MVLHHIVSDRAGILVHLKTNARHTPLYASSTGSNESDSVSATSSVRPLPVPLLLRNDSSDFDEEVHPTRWEFPTPDTSLQSPGFKFHKEAITEVGAQFTEAPFSLGDVALCRGHSRGLSLFPNSTDGHPGHSIWYAIYHIRRNNNLSLQAVPTVPWAVQPVRLTMTLPLGAEASTIRATVPIVRSAPPLTLEPRMDRAAPTAGSGTTSPADKHIGRTQKFLNPFFLIYPDKFKEGDQICVNCYSRPADFLRAIFALAEKNADDLKIKDADILMARQEGHKRVFGETKLRKIWERLLIHKMDVPLFLPVAARSHVCVKLKKSKHAARLATSPMDHLAPTIAVSQLAGTEVSRTASSSALDHPPGYSLHQAVGNSELDQFTFPSGPGLTKPRTANFSTQSSTQKDQIHDIIQYLLRLHKLAHADTLGIGHEWSIRVLGGALCSINLLVEQARCVMYSDPPNGRPTANFEDLYAPCVPDLPQLDHRDKVPSVQQFLIEDLDGALQRFCERANGVPDRTQHQWRASVLDLALYNIRILLDEALRTMASLPATEQYPHDSHGSYHDFSVDPVLNNGSSSILQSSVVTPHGSSTITHRSITTAATSLISHEQDLTNHSRRRNRVRNRKSGGISGLFLD